ncbi:MAG: amidohydrolase family protein [Acidobacteriota bacterium]
MCYRLAPGLVLSVALCAPPLAAPEASAAEPILIRGGTLLTITDGTIEGGDLLIRDGRIAAIGHALEGPPGARVIDARGRFVMPGIVDTHSHMGVYPWPEIEANADGNEMTDPVTADMRAADAIHTEDPEFERARAGGVTTVQIIPGSGNLIGGEGLTIKLRPTVDLERLRFEGAPQGIKMALGENPKRVYGRRDAAPSTRMGNLALLREAFTRARNYQAKWEAWNAGDPLARKAPPDRDMELEVLSDVLEGRVLVHVHSYRPAEILRFLEVADEYGFRVASFQHCLEGYKIADELKRRDIAVATFAHWWGYKVEAWEGIPHNAAMLAREGVRVSIHSDSGNLVQRLYTEAAVAARYGLSVDDALRAITLNAASALGVDDRVGSLEVGKDADIAIFTRHPLDVYALVETTLIDGEVVYQRPEIPTPDSVPPAPDFPEGPSAPPPGELVPAPAPVNDAGLYAVVGGRVFTMDGPPIDGATVVVERGVIREVGAGLAPPPGATVIDATGLWVFPGFIDSRSYLGLREIDLVQAMRDEDEGSDPVLPHLRVLDAYNLESAAIPVTRVHGITSAFIAPGEGNVIAGLGGLVGLAGRSPAEALIAEDVALAVNFGEPPKGRSGPRHRSPATRMGIAAVLRGALSGAANYRAKWEHYEARRKARADGSIAAGSGPPVPPDRDLRMEALLPVLDGRRPLFARAHRVDDILTAVRLADEFDLKLILSYGTEAYKVADILAAKNIPVVVGPVSTQPERVETLGAIYENAARLHAAGVKIAFQSSGSLDARMLPYEAALAVAYGLPWEEAIRGLTANAAEIFGVSDRIGRLAPGLRADLIVTGGDPLQPVARLRHLMIAGRPVPLTTMHTELYAKWR